MGIMMRNYLNYVPEKTNRYLWEHTKNDRIIIHVVNTGIYNKIAQILFKKPKISHIKLDEYGSTVWEYIDGENTVYDIAKLLKARYGENIEPLYRRLIQYLKILSANNMIIYSYEDNVQPYPKEAVK